MRTVNCECGTITGERCQWSGQKSRTVIVEWMPEHHRASHEAARNHGVYLSNGAFRLRVERSCAERIIHNDPRWAAIVADAVAA